MMLKNLFLRGGGMAIHSYIPAAMPSRFSVFSSKQTDFFATHNDPIVGKMHSVPRFWHLAGLFHFTGFFPIPINSQQKAAYIARFACYSFP
jgi:hypothetical protein